MGDMLKTLTRRSFAANRLRSLITALAIALVAMLFTSVTTIAMGSAESVKRIMQIQKMSISDGDFRYMDKEQFEAMRQSDLIEKAGLRMPVGYLTNTLRHNVEFNVQDEIQSELTFCMPTGGRVPKKADEIVVSDKALQELGAEPGDSPKISITFTAHGKEYTIPMKVCGWYEAINEQTSVAWACTAFRDAHPEIFRYTFREDGEMAGTYWSDIIAAGRENLRENMYELARSLGGDPQNIEAPNSLPAVVNQQTNPELKPSELGMGALVVVLFVFCGYLLIFNIFDIAVMQEIRRYGLYRTIGMSRRQVKSLINGQALRLYCAGTPAGLLIGFFTGKAALPYIMNMYATEYKVLVADASPSVQLFLGAALLTAMTVFISTRRPVRMAAEISPVEAFRYVERGIGRRTFRKSAPGARLSRLAWFNLGRSKRRSVFIVLSLALCIALLNCAGTAAAAPVYKNTIEDENVTYDYGHPLTGQRYVMEESGLTVLIDEQTRALSLGSDGRPICNVYGMQEEAIARMDLREGETDPHILYEKMEKGQGVLAGVEADRKDMSIKEIFDQVDVGEVITVYKDGEPVMELPVLAKAAINGDDSEIGFTNNGSHVVGGQALNLYLPSKVYCALYDEPVIYKYSFNAKEGYEDSIRAFLNDYMENADPGINYLSARSARESAQQMQRMIRFVGGIVGLILGIAGILNLINTMVTTILTRRREFAAMQSVGMTRRQLTEMMVLEGLYYAIGAGLTGLVLATVLNLTLVRGILGGMWYCTFRFTLAPALAVSVILLILSAVIPALTLKFFHRGSVVEQLRVTE